MGEFHTVAAVADIPNNASHSVSFQGLELLVCHADGAFYVVENRCSHQDQPLAGGRIRGGTVACPVHGMRYKLENGEPIGQLSRIAIRTFPTRVHEGQVQVSLAD